MTKIKESRQEPVRPVVSVVLAAILGLAIGCGGGGRGSQAPVTVNLPVGGALTADQSVTLNAAVSDGSAVSWSVAGGGALNQLPGQTANSITYTAPLSVSSYTPTTVTATTRTGASAYSAFTIVPQNAIPNLQPVSVDGGPVAGQIYPNGAFTTVTVCTPGTATCNTIDGILVDTGSVGLRVLASALPSLPAVTDSKGNAISECDVFVDHSFVWGQVVLADLRVAGEQAISLPMQSIADPQGFPIPSACSGTGSGGDDDSQQTLGANGILGVGLEPQDCGMACADSNPPSPAYYSCAGSACNPTSVPLFQQVINPVYLFGSDNNGFALQFPALSGAAATLSGNMIFGIGTRANNVLGDATIFTVDANDNFTTNFTSTGQSLTASFIDSGSNGFLFPAGSIPVCPSPDTAFFCPGSVVQLSAVNLASGIDAPPINPNQSTIDFSVDNAGDLFSNDPTAAAFGTLAGPNGTGSCANGSGACSFDWGLPFFYGRTVISAINGRSVSSSGTTTVPPSPWWAYATKLPGQ